MARFSTSIHRLLPLVLLLLLPAVFAQASPISGGGGGQKVLDQDAVTESQNTGGGRKNETDGIPATLFNELEELSRIVDISYCVGATGGIEKPFECAGRCAEFEGFELVTVSLHLSFFTIWMESGLML